MNRRVNLQSSTVKLEQTYSIAEVMAHLGCKKTKIHELLKLGRLHKGCAPLKGGLWPVFKVSHKNVRITATAIENHKRHMQRLDEDPIFSGQQRARAA